MANISAINFGGSIADTRPYGTCSTTVSTKAKTVSISDFELYEGASVLVKFNNGNSAASPTLNVNSTGAKTIRFNGSAISNSLYYSWSAGAVLEFIYDGTYWNLMTTCNTNTDNDTKNTAGSTDTNDKIYLIGATSQEANPQTYSHDTAYVGSDGYLYSNSTKVDMSKLDEKADTDLTPTLILQGTAIPSNADLNTVEYLKIGVYNCRLYETAKSLKNCPVDRGFRMEVYSYLSSNTDDSVLTTAEYVYRIRKIINISGEQYYQYVYSTTRPGVFTYDDWYYVPTTKATIDTTDTNGSSVATGNASTPVYIDSAGKFASCTGVYNDSQDCLPKTTTTYNLGSTDYKWNNIYANNFVGNITGNADSATKLTSSAGSQYVPVYFNDGVPTQCTGIADSLLTWDNSSSGARINLNPIDMAISSYHSANRLAFSNPDGITVEYSRDGGSTWTDYGLSNELKTCLVSGIGASNIYIGGRQSDNTANDQLRVTLNARTMGVYTRGRKIMLNVSTENSQNTKVKVELSKIGTPTTFETQGIYDVAGWSGWNSIPYGAGAFGGGESQTTQCGTLRLTFTHTLSTSGKGAFRLIDILLFGDTTWTMPSKMAKTGHLYSYSYTQDMILPASIYPDTNVNATLGTVNRKWTDAYIKKLHIPGTNSSSAFLHSDTANNLYANVNGVIPFVIDASSTTAPVIRCSSSMGNKVDLGTSTYKWNNIYANNFKGTADIAKTLPHFKISSNGQLPTDGSPEYVKFATITIPTSAWARKSVTLFFQDYEANCYQGDILTIQASSNASGVGSTPNVKWVTKYQKSTIDSIIISKVSDNVYDLYLEAATLHYITLRVFYLTLDDVGADKTFNFINNASDWSTTVPDPITSRSTLKNVASELGDVKTLWGQPFDGTANVSGDMTGVGSITMSKALKINGSNADTANLHFGRTTYNYISSPSESTIHMCPGGITKDSTHGYVFGASEFYPGTTDAYSLGSSSLKWANVYATTFTGNLTGNVTGNVTGSSGSCTGNAATATTATTATNANNVYINTSTSSSYYPMTFVTTVGVGNKALYIDSGTGTTSSSNGIRYNPSDNTCYCSGGFYEASDERLKNFGDNIEVDLDKLSKLSKKYFTWKDDKSNAQHIGVSAQEVQAIYPELVEVIDEEGHLSVSYDKLSVVALKGIDVLNDKVKSLEERLERLEKLLNV